MILFIPHHFIKKSLIYCLYVSFVGILTSGCKEAPISHHSVSQASSNKTLHASTIQLTQIPLDSVKQSGRILIQKPYGLHLIESPHLVATTQPSSSLPNQSTSKQSTSKQSSSKSTHRASDIEKVIVFVHGYKSRGYEWIYPIHHSLKSQKNASQALFFYRWNWQECPQKAAQELWTHLQQLHQKYKPASLHVMAHSYGGVILAHTLSLYTLPTPLYAHTVAAPLAGHPSLTQRCAKSTISTKISPQTHLHQWRTQHQLDSAFKNLTPDPQVIKLPGTVTTLPAQYHTHRLGHNRSLSWVIEQKSIGF